MRDCERQTCKTPLLETCSKTRKLLYGLVRVRFIECSISIYRFRRNLVAKMFSIAYGKHRGVCSVSLSGHCKDLRGWWGRKGWRGRWGKISVVGAFITAILVLRSRYSPTGLHRAKRPDFSNGVTIITPQFPLAMGEHLWVRFVRRRLLPRFWN